MFFLDVTHTSHTRAQTGIQRVARSLFGALQQKGEAIGVCYDPYFRAWRSLDPREIKHMGINQPAVQSRGSRWTLSQRIQGHAGRWFGGKPSLPEGTGLICPEIFSGKAGPQYPQLFAKISGPRVAIFYDAIPLQYPELTPPGTVARFPGYLRELLQFDGVAAISETSASILREYWNWLGAVNPPPVIAIPLAIGPAIQTESAIPAPTAQSKKPRLLCVSTVEGRKNHLALLEACERLWQEGQAFELQLIGLARPDTAQSALTKITALQNAGRPLLYVGSVDDLELHSAYRECSFTVYPSLIEGFGLPVLESLRHGKPCICSGLGALGESARNGGCVALEKLDGVHLANAIRALLESPDNLASLTHAARARRFKSWTEYTNQLTDWMTTLDRRP